MRINLTQARQQSIKRPTLILLFFLIGLVPLITPGRAIAQSTPTQSAPIQAAPTQPTPTGTAETPVTERITLVKPDDFPSVWYDHGCPNCGIVLVGEITRKLNHKVARIDKVVFVSQTSTANWYRCGVLTDVCGTKGEFTADFSNKSGGCEGKTSCYLWRFSTDASPATDIVEVTYLPRF